MDSNVQSSLPDSVLKTRQLDEALIHKGKRIQLLTAGKVPEPTDLAKISVQAKVKPGRNGNRLPAHRFKPGQSGNPGGKPKKDLAAEIARGVFERNPQVIGAAMLKGLIKGNSGMARMYQVLSDRGFGKLTEHLQIDAQVSAGVADRLDRARLRARERALELEKDKP